MADSTIKHTLRMMFPRPPHALEWLIWLNVAISILLWIFGGAEILMLPSQWREVADQPWSMLTYMFTQTGVLHLLFNMLWLYWFGMMLHHGGLTRSIFPLYLFGGVGGGVLFLLSSQGDFGVGVLSGSSAAVMALIVAVACRLPNGRVNLLLIGRVRVVWIAIAALALTFLGGGGGMTGGFSAHLGGALVGLAYGLWPFVGRKDWQRDMHALKIKMHQRRHRFDGFGEDWNDDYDDETSGRSLSESKERADARGRLDELLDKIRTSGYDSLTRRERKELDRLSQQL